MTVSKALECVGWIPGPSVGVKKPLLQLCLSFLPQSRWITVPATAMVTATASPGLATASWASWALTAAEVSAPPHPVGLRVPILQARAEIPASSCLSREGLSGAGPAEPWRGGLQAEPCPGRAIHGTCPGRSGGKGGHREPRVHCGSQSSGHRVLCKSRFPLGGQISVCRASLTCISRECGLSLALGRA